MLGTQLPFRDRPVKSFPVVSCSGHVTTVIPHSGVIRSTRTAVRNAVEVGLWWTNLSNDLPGDERPNGVTELISPEAQALGRWQDPLGTTRPTTPLPHTTLRRTRRVSLERVTGGIGCRSVSLTKAS